MILQSHRGAIFQSAFPFRIYSGTEGRIGYGRSRDTEHRLSDIAIGSVQGFVRILRLEEGKRSKQRKQQKCLTHDSSSEHTVSDPESRRNMVLQSRLSLFGCSGLRGLQVLDMASFPADNPQRAK